MKIKFLRSWIGILFALVLATVNINAYAGKKGKIVAYVASAIISGAVSGYVAAEVTIRYSIKKGALNGDQLSLDNAHYALSISDSNESVRFNAGTYEILAKGYHKKAQKSFVVAELDSRDDAGIFFLD